MNTELYEKLVALDQATKLTENELNYIESILSGDFRSILNTLEDPKFKLQSRLSIKILVSLRFESLTPDQISIKYRCFKNLKNQIIQELIENELKKTLSQIEDSIFDSSSQITNWHSILKVFSEIFSFYGLFTLKTTRSSFIDRLEELSDIQNAKNTIDTIINEHNSIEIFEEILTSLKENRKILERIGIYVQTLGKNEKTDLILASINRAKFQMPLSPYRDDERKIECRHPNGPISFNVASKLDDTIQNLIAKSEGSIRNFITFQNRKIPFEQYDSQTFNFQEFESDFKKSNENFKQVKMHTFCEFESCLTLFLSKFLSMLSSYNFFARCYTEYIFEKKDFFKSLLQELRSKDIVLSQTILQHILPLNESSEVTTLLRYLCKVPDKCVKLDPESVFQFRQLLNEQIIQNALNFFNTSKGDLNNMLDSAVSSIYIMDLPERVYGITLWTLHIVIKPFQLDNKIHLLGAQFVVLLHELAHYLQRAACTTVEESKESFSPKLLKDTTLNEGGFILEKNLFGEIIEEVSLNQAKFLLKGGFPTEIESFRKEFMDLKVSSTESLNVSLHRSCNKINLGRCGSYFINEGLFGE